MTYQEENNVLVETYIKKKFLKKIDEIKTLDDAPSIEFYVNTVCDLKCSYCYLHNHRSELYPAKIQSKATILKNAEAILKYMSDNDYVFRLELFSGELFSQDLGFELLDLIYSYLQKKPGFITQVMVPSNMNFLLDDKRLDKIEEYLYKFHHINTPLRISASVDGPCLSENRSFTTDKEVRDEAFYDRLFAFVKMHGCGLHPMVSAVGIEKWVENYDWFSRMIKKHDIKDRHGELIEPMMLEVRNNDWTDESIEHLLKFYDHLFDRLMFKHGGKEEFAKKLYDRKSERRISTYCNIEYTCNNSNYRDISCAIQKMMHIRLGDLAIVNCHRLSYEELLLAKIKTDEENNVVGIDAINPSMLLTKTYAQSTILPVCDKCKYASVCMKGCLGAQYEHNSDMFYPIPAVCKMLKAKYDHITKKYIELGLFEEMFKYIDEEQKAYFKQLIEEVENNQ